MLSTTMKAQVNRWRTRLFHWHRHSRALLPGECLICAEPVIHPQDLCTACRNELPVNACCCSHCAEPLSPGLTSVTDRPLRCAHCGSQPPAFDQVLAPWLYAPPLDRLLMRFKYQQDRTAGYLLLDLLMEALPENDHDALLVIPGQKERIRERGLHAPGWLASRLARHAGWAYRPEWLLRQKAITSQQALNRKARWLNPRGAFKASPAVAGKTLLLLDDVVTTGATVHWASQALKAAGALRVDVMCVARTPA